MVSTGSANKVEHQQPGWIQHEMKEQIKRTLFKDGDHITTGRLWCSTWCWLLTSRWIIRSVLAFQGKVSIWTASKEHHQISKTHHYFVSHENHSKVLISLGISAHFSCSLEKTVGIPQNYCQRLDSMLLYHQVVHCRSCYKSKILRACTKY